MNRNAVFCFQDLGKLDKAFASSADGPAIKSLPCLTPGLAGSELGLIGPASVHCTVAGRESKFDLQLLSRRGSSWNCLSRSVPEMHSECDLEAEQPGHTYMAAKSLPDQDVHLNVCSLFENCIGINRLDEKTFTFLDSSSPSLVAVVSLTIGQLITLETD